MSSLKMSKKSEQLLEAQVAFMVAQVSGENLEPVIKSNLTLILENAKSIPLADVVSKESVKKVAIKYASNMVIGPGVPELVGDIAREIYDHDIFDNNSPKDVVSQKHVIEILTKLSEMKDARIKLVSEVVSNPMYTSLMSDLLYHGIEDYITDNPLAKKIPGAQSVMKFGKNMMDKASPNLEASLKKYVASNISSTLKESERFLNKNLTNERIVDIGLDAWESMKDAKLSVYKKYLSSNDIEEFFVLGFEQWKQLRKTDIYQEAIEEVIDFFFKKYGTTSLFELLDEMSIDEEMLLDDAMTFAPQALNYLIEQGVLADFVRQYLAPFYMSDIAQQILAD